MPKRDQEETRTAAEKRRKQTQRKASETSETAIDAFLRKSKEDQPEGSESVVLGEEWL